MDSYFWGPHQAHFQALEEEQGPFIWESAQIDFDKLRGTFKFCLSPGIARPRKTILFVAER